MKSDQATDRIAYTEPFKESVEGRLKARFRVDSDGTPMYESHDEDPRLRVYTIDVFLATPRTKEIKGVKYYMDDDSYVDPEGYSDDASNEFREEITSYGDVEIVVTVEMSNHKKYEQRAWLSNMLENGHADDMTPAIRAAIQRIKVN
jgi:hypothetical protein